MTKLNPCPQCGNEPNINTLDLAVSICCGRCDSDDEYFVMSKSAIQAINAWNEATSESNSGPSDKTLRDEFAMHSPFSAREIADALIAEGVEPTTDVIAAHLAFINYAYADEMLKERNK